MIKPWRTAQGMDLDKLLYINPTKEHQMNMQVVGIR